MDKSIFGELPLTEFDADRFAIIEPLPRKGFHLPEQGVIVFYSSVIEGLLQANRLIPIFKIGSVLTPIEVYRLDHSRNDVTVVCPSGCGGPLAAALLEELIAYGCRKVVACGSAGCLKSELVLESIVIPHAAVRDEGTSFHYLPPSRTILVEPAVIRKMEKVLNKHNIGYQVGLNWTTDAPYRETRQKIARRKSEGCLTVDMEFASMLAVARFRKVPFGQYMLVADDISGEEWDNRGWASKSPAHEKGFWLAVEACLSL